MDSKYYIQQEDHNHRLSVAASDVVPGVQVTPNRCAFICDQSIEISMTLTVHEWFWYVVCRLRSVGAFFFFSILLTTDDRKGPPYFVVGEIRKARDDDI